MLYVVAEGALDPADVCYIIHLCNSSSHAQSSSPLLSLLETSWHKRQWTPTHSLAGALEGNSLREEPAVRGAGKRGGRLEKKGGDPIVFLQLSDIHLDQLFAEASNSLSCNLKNHFSLTIPHLYVYICMYTFTGTPSLLLPSLPPFPLSCRAHPVSATCIFVAELGTVEQ